jgi:hypothetical protein
MSRRYRPTDTPRELIEFFDGAPDQTLIPTGNAKDRRANAKDRRVDFKTAVYGPWTRRIGEMDRRAVPDRLMADPIERPAPLRHIDALQRENEEHSGELLSKYRAALIHAYELGKEVKIVYGIVPPKVLHRVGNEFITLSLGVN